MSAEALAIEYAAKLLPIRVAADKFAMEPKTFLRFRHRHNIRTLPGNKVHVEDVIQALERERQH
jgi:hypothetical protein